MQLIIIIHPLFSAILIIERLGGGSINVSYISRGDLIISVITNLNQQKT